MQVRKTFEAQRACIMQTREWVPGSKPRGRALLKYTWLSVSVDCGRSMSPATNLQLGVDYRVSNPVGANGRNRRILHVAAPLQAKVRRPNRQRLLRLSRH